PSRRLPWPQLGIDLLQSLPLRLQVRLRIMVGRLQLRMPQPTLNHGDIHAGGKEVDRSRVSKDMRGNPFLGDGGDGLRRRLDVLTQTEAESGGRERRLVSIHENRLFGFSRFPS